MLLTLTIKFLLASLCPKFKELCLPSNQARVLVGIRSWLLLPACLVSVGPQELLIILPEELLTLFSLFHPLLPHLTRRCCLHLPIHPPHSHQRDPFPHCLWLFLMLLRWGPNAFVCCATLSHMGHVMPSCLTAPAKQKCLAFSLPCICCPSPSLCGNGLFWSFKVKQKQPLQGSLPTVSQVEGEVLPSLCLILNSHSPRPSSRRFKNPDFGVRLT